MGGHVICDGQQIDELERGLPIRALETKEKTSLTEQPQFAIDLNNHALLLRQLKRLDEAAALLHRAIGIEDRSLPPNHPKRAHRRNNLAIICMLVGRLDEAGHINAEAWSLKAGQHDVTSGRILLARIALCWLRNADASHYLSQLRTLLAQPELSCLGEIDRHWKAADILGWSAIGPILYLMEYAIGLRADAPRNKLAWNLTPGVQHGCERYRFNGHVTSLLAEPLADKPGGFQVSVDSDGSFTLSLASGETTKDFAVQAGRQFPI